MPVLAAPGLVLRNSPASWGSVAKGLHWLVAAAIMVQVALGLAAVWWRVSPTKLDLFVVHKSLGIVILLVVALRLTWRLANPPPVLPTDMSAWEKRAAHASHVSLYVLLFAMPLTGWFTGSAANVPFRIFWHLPWPTLVAPDEALAKLGARVHLGLFIVLAAVLLVHVGAALWHHYVRGDDVLKRMLPWPRSAR